MKEKGCDHELAVANLVHDDATDDDSKAESGEAGAIDVS